MKTRTINLYSVSELSDAAKETAHNNYLSNGYFQYAWIDESLDSVRAYVEHFGGKVTNWSFDTYRRGDSYIKVEIDNPRGFKANQCPEFLTGYDIDETFRIAFLDYAKRDGDIRGAVLHAVDECLSDILNDMESQETLYYFIDMAEANEWEFTENGDFA